MAFAPQVKNKQSSTNIAKSTWTPMTNTGANSQVFEERRTIIKKWFEKWHEKQRRIVIEDIFNSLSEKHLLSVHNELSRKFPEEKFDFTKRLPRVLTLYVFSFLDPRSLCRCAQVSWYWKYLTELDCIWRPKCLRFGWYPTHQPSQYEETIWKRHYIKTIYQLHYAKAKPDEPKHEEMSLNQPDTARTDRTHLSSARSHMSSASTTRRKRASVAPKSVPIPVPKWEPPPWKGSDPNPTDTMRYNYLDNTQNKNKSKNPRRPKSASGSVVSGRITHSPLKSSMEPRPSSSSHSKNLVVTQSLDPQALKTKDGGHGAKMPTASARNMMSASVSNFTYTGSPNLHGSMNGGGTLEASTYYVNANSSIKQDMGGTLNASTRYTSGLHGQSPVRSPTIPQQSQAMPDLSHLTMKDATIRPKPVTKLSVEKSLSSSVEKQKEFKNEPDPSVKKPVATMFDYQVKDANKNGKATPLQGNPWKTQEVVSDDSDF